MNDLNDSRYIHYGCGCSAPSGWRNFDASPTLRFERLPVIGRLYTKNAFRFPQNVEYGGYCQGSARSARSLRCGVLFAHSRAFITRRIQDCLAEHKENPSAWWNIPVRHARFRVFNPTVSQ